MLIVDVGTMHVGVGLGVWLGALPLGQIAALRADNDSSKHLQPYNSVNLPPQSLLTTPFLGKVAIEKSHKDAF